MRNEYRSAGNNRSERFKAGLLRWWLAGMCYFLVGFGTQAGSLQDPIDLIFLLSVAVGVSTIAIYQPIAYSVFNLEKNDVNLNRQYKERRGWRKALYNLLVVVKCTLIVFLVYLTYQNINILLVQLRELPEETVVFAGEPFGFATLYIIYHAALSGLIAKVRIYRRTDKN